MDDVIITVHHASVGPTKGYTVEYNFYGWRSKTYQNLDAQTIFSNDVLFFRLPPDAETFTSSPAIHSDRNYCACTIFDDDDLDMRF